MASFDRRAVIAGALSVGLAPCVARAAGPVPASKALHFNILRNGKPFGQYNVAFVENGELLTVTTEVAMNMRIAAVTVFDYVHHCEEIWHAGQFMELRSRSVRDRQRDQTDTVVAVRGGTGIHITTNKGPRTALSAAKPLTHWNAEVLHGPMFNPQDGSDLVDLTARPLGRDAVPVANGTTVMGAHWMLRGSQTLDEWYDDAGVWAGLKAIFPDKSVIEYRRT